MVMTNEQAKVLAMVRAARAESTRAQYSAICMRWIRTLNRVRDAALVSALVAEEREVVRA